MSDTRLMFYPIFMILSVLMFAGCMSGPKAYNLNEYTSPSADQSWTPIAGSSQQNLRGDKEETRNDFFVSGKVLSLSDIIEVALQNNPATRAAWRAARSAADDWLSQKADYSPLINASAASSHRVTMPDTASKKGSSTLTSVVSFNPTVQLSWLIFDFGGRDAAVDEKYQALLAADFTHNGAIQDSVFQTIAAYFQYANAKAVKKTYEISLKDATTNLDAAEQRHKNGLATIADVLQLKTALSQAQVKLDVAEGQVQTIRGALAAAMGIPITLSFETEDLPLTPELENIDKTIDACIEQAQINRPELAAQKSRVEQALAHIRTTHSSLYPTLVFSDTLGGAIDSQTSKWQNQNTAGIRLSIPIFDGNSLEYKEDKAKEDAENQKAILDKLENSINYEVWSSYFSMKTSAQRVKSNDDLINNAQQSQDVALGRYREGVGGYLELLSAQSALESARAQRVTALADWYISLAQLARSTGMLWQQTEDDKGNVFDLYSNDTVKDQKP
jgi:outer membrane protein